MKTRIHIHRESISGTIGRKTFIVTLPRDAGTVVGIIVSARGLKQTDGENHFEAGFFRMQRDGALLYEQQVRNEDQAADFDFNPIPVLLDQSPKHTSGGKEFAHNVRFEAAPRSLFCRYDGNKSQGSLPYTLYVYFIYEQKQKQ